MQNGPLHNIRLDLMILETFCNLNDSVVTQYQPQKSYQKNYKPEIHFWHFIHTLAPLEHHSPCLSKSISIKDIKLNSKLNNSILDVFRREGEKNTQLFFKHMREHLVWFLKGTKHPSYYRSYETRGFTQTYNVWRQKTKKLLHFKSSNLFRIRD